MSVESHARPLEHLAGDVDRSGQHQGRLRAHIGEGPDAGARRELGGAAGRAAADEDRGGAVDDAGRVAGMVHVIDGLDLGMRLHGDRIEAAHLAHLHEGRLQLRQRLHAGAGAHVLVLGQDGQPVDVPDREHRAGETPLVPGHGGALLALDRVGVDLGAGEAVFGGDEIGGNALRHEIGRQRDRRIDRPGAAGGADADPAHGFDAAADRHVVLAGHDLRGREVDGIEAGGAEAVDLHARHAVAVAGRDGGGARDVAARLAHRIDAAQHHVIDQLGVERIALPDAGERLGGEIERRHLVQRAVDLAAPARGAQVIVDERIGHRVSNSVAASASRLSSLRQNASAGNSITLAAPSRMRARCSAVSGNIRSTKKRPVTSLSRMRPADGSAASLAHRGCRQFDTTYSPARPVPSGAYSQWPRPRHHRGLQRSAPEKWTPFSSTRTCASANRGSVVVLADASASESTGLGCRSAIAVRFCRLSALHGSGHIYRLVGLCAWLTVFRRITSAVQVGDYPNHSGENRRAPVSPFFRLLSDQNVAHGIRGGADASPDCGVMRSCCFCREF